MPIKHIIASIFLGTSLGLFGFLAVLSTGLLDGGTGKVGAYVITSGSMEPVLPVGSIAITKQLPEYQVGDIVTFYPDAERKSLVTHRITSIENGAITTKGDANQDEDFSKVTTSQIVGKTTYSLPHVGYIVNFAKTPQGFIALVVIPATIVIYEELKTIFRELKKSLQKFLKKEGEWVGNKTKPYWRFAAFIPVIGFGFLLTALSVSYFSDTEVSNNNILGAAASFGTPSPSPTSSPAPSSAPLLVINEVYYDTGDRGQGANRESEGQNEWIEIYNPGLSPVPFKDWEICDNNSCVTVNPAVSVPANGFLLISHNASTWNFWDEPTNVPTVNSLGGTPLELANAGDEVVLKNPDGNIIDAMSYGTNTDQLNPSVAGASEGNSLERVPDGLDTDTNSDFVEQDPPTPGS